MAKDAEVIAAGDLSLGRIGKLEGDAFVVENVGELEFEVEENELSLTVEDVNGEFAIFVPDGKLYTRHVLSSQDNSNTDLLS